MILINVIKDYFFRIYFLCLVQYMLVVCLSYVPVCYIRVHLQSLVDQYYYANHHIRLAFSFICEFESC